MIVYLDTNAYIAAHYIFDRDKFAMLLKLLSEDKIKLIYTSATQGEVEKHLEEDIKSQVMKYNRLLRKDMKSFVGDNTYILNQMNCEEVLSCFRERFNNFLNHKNVEIISLNPLDAEILLQDYFYMNPPFESKKPNEFKDAIMITRRTLHKDNNLFLIKLFYKIIIFKIIDNKPKKSYDLTQNNSNIVHSTIGICLIHKCLTLSFNR